MQSEAKLKSRIVSGRFDFEGDPWHLLQAAKVLIRSLLTVDHLLRATAQSAMDSQWISSEIDDLESAYHWRVLENTE